MCLYRDLHTYGSGDLQSNGAIYVKVCRSVWPKYYLLNTVVQVRLDLDMECIFNAPYNVRLGHVFEQRSASRVRPPLKREDPVGVAAPSAACLVAVAAVAAVAACLVAVPAVAALWAVAGHNHRHRPPPTAVPAQRLRGPGTRGHGGATTAHQWCRARTHDS